METDCMHRGTMQSCNSCELGEGSQQIYHLIKSRILQVTVFFFLKTITSSSEVLGDISFCIRSAPKKGVTL